MCGKEHYHEGSCRSFSLRTEFALSSSTWFFLGSSSHAHPYFEYVQCYSVSLGQFRSDALARWQQLPIQFKSTFLLSVRNDMSFIQCIEEVMHSTEVSAQIPLNGSKYGHQIVTKARQQDAFIQPICTQPSI